MFCSDRLFHQILSVDSHSSFFGFKDTFTLLSILKGKTGKFRDQHSMLVCPVKFFNQLIFYETSMKGRGETCAFFIIFL